jgi:serine/threonine protein kinase
MAVAVTPELTAELVASRRAELAGKKLSSFQELVQIGGKDPTHVQIHHAQNGYADNGVNSRVYSFKVAGGGCDGAKLVLKVMINVNPHVPPATQFEPEYRILLDGGRLPPHRNVMAVFSHFIDESSAANGLPNWDLDDEWVVKNTSFITMPFFPRDLKNALQSEKNAGNRIPADRARRIICDILSAVQHLQAHRIAHCDLKMDNVLLQNVKTVHEVAVVTDFGCCKDFNGYAEGHMAMPFPAGMLKGGSPMALAPEIHHAGVGGPGQIIDYSANDQFAAGLIAHEILAGQADHAFLGCDDGPSTYQDQLYVDVEPDLYDDVLRCTVRELLRTDPAQRRTTTVALEELRKPLAAPAPPSPAPVVAMPWPGPLQEQWDPLYERVKNQALFGTALDWIEQHPEAVNYRSGGPTGWTMLHQAAYWMIPKGLLKRIRGAGGALDADGNVVAPGPANPLLLAQNYRQLQDGYGTATPLEITAENEGVDQASKDKRKAWREMYAEVFELGSAQPVVTRGANPPVLPAPVEMEPAPAIDIAGDWKLCTCQATLPPQSPGTYVLTAAHKGDVVSMQPRKVPADARQLWKLGEHGHLICQAGNFCVDIDGKNVAEGAKIILWDVKLPHPDYPPAKNQQWVHVAGGTQTTTAIAQRSSAHWTIPRIPFCCWLTRSGLSRRRRIL